MTTPQFWKKWKTPWTRDQCRRRYVEGGDDIGIRQLAKDSGQPKGTLERWSTKELWVDQRRQYEYNLRTATQEKTIEKTSEKLGEELSEIAVANYKSHQLARDCAASIFQMQAQYIHAIQKLPVEEQLEAVKPYTAHMNYWSQILSRATQGIEAATGLPYYVDVSAAAKRIEREGYIISEGEAQNPI